MLTWSRYRFKQRLLFKCNITHAKVIIVNEAYTIKTCSKCGNLNWGIGGKKIFKCPKSECGMVMDPEANAAKNTYSRRICKCWGFQFRLPSQLWALPPCSLRTVARRQRCFARFRHLFE